MKTEFVEVVPYNPNWKIEFNKIADEIKNTLDTLAISIEHIGSTSVEGLSAKPIIDIDIVIKDNSILNKVIEKLSNVGYIFEGDLGIKDRYAFKYENKPHLMLHHLYVCPENSKELKRHIAFRNYLRNHPDDVQEYSKIKEQGAKLYPNDIDKYIQYKSDLIEKIYVKHKQVLMFYTKLNLKDNKIYLHLTGTYEAIPGKKWVPSYSFDICLKDGTKVGFCNFRVDNSELTKYCGNIGYGIDEKYRGHHYSAIASKLLLKLAKKHNLDYVLINCEPDNIASNKICQLLGAEFIETVDIPKTHEMYLEGKRQMNIYQINL